MESLTCVLLLITNYSINSDVVLVAESSSGLRDRLWGALATGSWLLVSICCFFFFSPLWDSFALCLSCSKYQKPAWVLADTIKISNRQLDAEQPPAPYSHKVPSAAACTSLPLPNWLTAAIPFNPFCHLNNLAEANRFNHVKFTSAYHFHLSSWCQYCGDLGQKRVS